MIDIESITTDVMEDKVSERQEISCQLLADGTFTFQSELPLLKIIKSASALPSSDETERHGEQCHWQRNVAHIR